VIPSAWKTKPHAVQYLTLIWGIIALHFLAYGIIFPVLIRDLYGVTSAILIVLVGTLLSWGHFQTKKIAWIVGLVMSLLWAIIASPNLLAYYQTLANLSQTNFALEAKSSFRNTAMVLPLAVLDACGMVSSLILVLVAFCLALSRPARLAYGIVRQPT
jgi:hypothetical protein